MVWRERCMRCERLECWMLDVNMQTRTITKQQTNITKQQTDPQQGNIQACVVGEGGVNEGSQRRLCLVGARYLTNAATHRLGDGLDDAGQDCCQGGDATRTSYTQSMSRRSAKDGHTLSLINAKPYGEQGDARGVRVSSAKFMCADKCVWENMHQHKPKDPGKEWG